VVRRILETGELVEKALDKARDDSRQAGPRSVSRVEFVDESWSARQADAMVSMASGYLSGNNNQTRSNSDDYLVTIHVDQSALKNENGRSSLPIESVKRLCCDGHAVVNRAKGDKAGSEGERQWLLISRMSPHTFCRCPSHRALVKRW